MRHTNRSSRSALGIILCATLAGAAHGQSVQIFPTVPAAVAPNSIPWGSGVPAGITVHQVFAKSLFSSLGPGQGARIERLNFSGTVTGHITLRLGYTDAVPGAPECGAGGLSVPSAAGGGAPNATAPMHTFYDAPVTSLGTGNTTFGMIYDGAPFVYEPARGNLLLEIHIPVRTAGSPSLSAAINLEASRAFQVHGGAASTPLSSIQSSPVEFTFTAVGICYANCDGSTAAPVLNVQDFACFLNAFAAGSAYANCDGSTTAPLLNVQDFSCFLNSFAAGCS
jgi:hypothetical protein